MKHAQRMVLVPETDYYKQETQKRKKIKKKNWPTLQPCRKRRGVKHKLAFLNTSAKKLYTQHRAAVKASQDVARLTLATKEDEITPTDLPAANHFVAEEEASLAKTDSTPAVLKTIPVQHRARAKKILDTLLKRGFRFTTAKNIQLPTGRVLVKTNIQDILRAAVVKDYRRKTSRPLGWTAFLDSIIRYRIPQSVFTKNSVKTDLEERTKYYSSESDVPEVWETYL